MSGKRPSSLRDEVRALRAEIALLRAEVATARAPVLPGLPADTSKEFVPVGGCSACRFSGACNCVRYDQMPTVCAPLDTTLQIAPGTTRMVSAWNAGAAALGPQISVFSWANVSPTSATVP